MISLRVELIRWIRLSPYIADIEGKFRGHLSTYGGDGGARYRRSILHSGVISDDSRAGSRALRQATPYSCKELPAMGTFKFLYEHMRPIFYNILSGPILFFTSDSHLATIL